MTETTERRGATRSTSSPRPPFRATEIAHPALLAVIIVSCVAALVARFVVPSPLWLDEALSVNIAKLPVGRIAEALRHDGHPPLYYYLLHGWISLFGDGDRTVRALSALISIGALPLAYFAGRRVAGRRVGWMTVIVLCISPYFLRYGSETRMYSLLILLVFAGYLVWLNALESGRWPWMVGIAVITALLLWTHYWSMWLLLSVGLLVVFRLWRTWRRDGRLDRAAVWVLVAMGVGGLLFVPWLPNMLYQAAHTGTPWAKPFKPATLVVLSMTDFSGGAYSETQVLMLFTVILLTVGVMGRGVDDWHIELDLHTQRDARIPAAVLSATVVIASVIGIITRSTFASRYASVFYPFFIILLALGLDHVRGKVTRNLTLGIFLVLSLIGLGVVFTTSRTQSRKVVEAMVAQHDPDAIVVTCPDQLGPSTDREVDGRWPVVTYPHFASPKRVDWVDYAERNKHNDPVAFAKELVARAGNRTIFTVMNNSYLTLGDQCGQVVDTLSALRPTALAVKGNADDFYEPMSLYVSKPPGG